MSSSSRLTLSSVRLNVGLVCVTLLLLLLIGVSLTTVNGNEFDSESHSGRSRLHHSRPSPSSSSSAILDAHQEVVPISLVESSTEESNTVEVDVGNNVITVTGDEEDPDLLSAINEENLAMTAIRAKYQQRQLNGAVSRLSKAAMAERQRKLVLNKKIAKKSTPGSGKGVAFRKVVGEVNQMPNRRNGISKRPSATIRTTTKGTTRTVGKKLGLFLELETELETELESESESESKSKSMVVVGVYPAFGLAGSTVGLLRNAIQADPAPLVLNGFTYVLDGGAGGTQVGRIQRAHGPVNVPFTTRPVKQLPVEWCDVQFNPVVPFIGPAIVAGRTHPANGGRALQQSGHIIGYAIGGSSDHAINFYPQHRSSNNQGGRWGKTEAIALHVAAAAGCPAGSVTVDIVFTAWSANGYPTAGTYDVEADAVCVAALNAAGGGAGCPGGGVVANAGVGNGYVRTFCRWANATPGGGLGYSTLFANGVGDVINNLAPLAAARYFP